jgi:hypothetical protein
MSGKDLLDEVKKEEDMQFVVVRKHRVILPSTKLDDLPEEIKNCWRNLLI